MSHRERVPTDAEAPPDHGHRAVRSAYETLGGGFHDPDYRGPASSLWAIDEPDEDAPDDPAAC